ncbi:hypothetical protein SDC9_115367 [bioreactor metagenome]|uniref:Uncharacterized protein n=1 Tax=bioreactor metagenome TaxID=1076179 RepID=A0A645BSY8_9ZZZZ
MHAGNGFCNAQHATVVKAQRVIIRFSAKRVRHAHRLARARAERRRDLGPLEMVVHHVLRRAAVEFDFARMRDERHATAVLREIKRFKVALHTCARIKRGGDIFGLRAHALLHRFKQLVVHQTRSKQRAEKHRQKDKRTHIEQYAALHILYPMPRTVVITSPYRPSFWRSVRTCTSTVRVSMSAL